MMSIIPKITANNASQVLRTLTRRPLQKTSVYLQSESHVSNSSVLLNNGNIIYEEENSIGKITLNRPKKKNALSSEMYESWIESMEKAAKNPRIALTVITGAGDFFSSGMDVSFFQSKDTGTFNLQRFLSTFINFPKLLIAVVNGPALGIAVTTLGLYDAVYATDKATFLCPFSQLGITAEGCSSYTFPMLMGTGKASEMLLFNKKITAEEAFHRGLVTRVFPDESFQQEVWPLIQEYASFSHNSMKYSKMLIRSLHNDNLHETNQLESTAGKHTLKSDEAKNAIEKFLSRKKKS